LPKLQKTGVVNVRLITVGAMVQILIQAGASIIWILSLLHQTGCNVLIHAIPTAFKNIETAPVQAH
jgi:hypothetical protein